MIEKTGRVIGGYRGKPIYDYIVEDGRELFYDRIAFTDSKGKIDPAQLKDGERLIQPGLIYRSISAAQPN